LSAFINFNGLIVDAGKMIIGADNRGFKFGEGLFETIKISDSQISLADFHFERLFDSMKKLRFAIADPFSPDDLTRHILALCEANGHEHAARVRLAVFRGDGGLYDSENDLPNFVIQSWPLIEKKFRWNKSGLLTDVFEDGRKSCDLFSNIKTNNFLIYALAAIHAKQNELNDCLILNSNDRVCESTIANIFCVKDKVLYTPTLSEGCIAGVMRRFLLERLRHSQFLFKETTLSIENVKQSEEIFLTNSIFGMRWVKKLGTIEFGHSTTKAIFEHLFADSQA
jgi:branched-chain amino acid aminotransferase